MSIKPETLKLISELTTMQPATSEQYKARDQLMLDRLDDLDAKDLKKLDDPVELAAAYKASNFLSSLACTTSNQRLAQDDRVWAMETRWNVLIGAYNQRFIVKNPVAVAVANYFLASKYCPSLNHQRLVNYLVSQGCLLKVQGHEAPIVCVVGLHKKLGDNVFSSRTNQRRFYTVGSRQAFPLDLSRTRCAGLDFSGVPDAPADAIFTITEIRDGGGKGAAKPPALTKTLLAHIASVAA